jgi:hypothetical protein
VVQVDKLGQTIAAGPVQAADKADQRVVHASVAEFINDARMVTPDVALQRKAVFRVYAKLAPNDPATAKMNEWLNGSRCQPVQARSEGNGQRRNQVGACRNRRHLASRLGGNHPRPSRDGEGPARDHARPGHDYTADTTSQTTDEQLRNNPMSIYVRDLLLVAPSMITRSFTMKKQSFRCDPGRCSAVPALALAAPGDDLADKYFSKNNPTLSAQEKAALAIAKKWNAGDRHEAGRRPNGADALRVSARSSPASFARCSRCATWPCRPASK